MSAVIIRSGSAYAISGDVISLVAMAWAVSNETLCGNAKTWALPDMARL